MAMLAGSAPYVVTPWGADVNLDMDRHIITGALSRISLRKAVLVICDAKFIKEKIVSWGVLSDRVKVIMFGVDFNRLNSSGQAVSGLRERYNLRNAPIIISTRLVTVIRDVETFVRAVPFVVKKIPSARFVAVGSGDERPRLEKMAKDGGYLDYIKFMGHVTESEMIQWLKTSDVYVSTSLTDAGLAASTAEAMACGLPVISTDNSENADWVHPGRGGYLYPNKDVEKLAEYIVLLLNNQQLCKRMGEYNRRMIEEKNNYALEMKKVEDAYLEVVKGRGGSYE